MANGKCSNCDGIPRKGGRYCLSCHAAYARKYRKKYLELSKDQRKKANCRTYTKMLVKRGQLLQPPCFCGEPSQRHHTDYDNPRIFIPLCKEHHQMVHRSN